MINSNQIAVVAVVNFPCYSSTNRQLLGMFYRERRSVTSKIIGWFLAVYEIRNAPFFILSLIIEIKPVEFKKHISFLEGMGGGGGSYVQFLRLLLHTYQVFIRIGTLFVFPRFVMYVNLFRFLVLLLSKRNKLIKLKLPQPWPDLTFVTKIIQLFRSLNTSVVAVQLTEQSSLVGPFMLDKRNV